MLQTLTNLQDVPGVIGSFVLNVEGALVARVMPSYVPDEVYPDLGRRLSTAFATMDASFGAYDDVLLKFDEHWLFCRRIPKGFLGIVSSPAVNYPALRMASNMAATKLNGLIPAPGEPMPVLAPAAGPAPVAPAPAPAAAPAPAYAPPPAAYTPAPAAAPPAAPAAPGHPGQPRPKRYWRGQPVDD